MIAGTGTKMEMKYDDLVTALKGNFQQADVTTIAKYLQSLNDTGEESSEGHNQVMDWIVELLDEKDGNQAIVVNDLYNAALISSL